MLDSSLFVKALGIGIAVAAPVGPMSLLCMRTTLTRGCGVSNMRSAELVGVAQPIACCGKFGGVGGRRQIAQRRVRSPPIVEQGLRTPTGPRFGSFCIRGTRGLGFR